MKQDKAITSATYPFAEAIDRIGQCTDKWELLLLASVLNTEKHYYSPYHQMLIGKAIEIMNETIG
jgi:hypothetical protein